MKSSKISIIISLALVLFITAFSAPGLAEHKKVQVTNMTTPFGTAAYTVGQAFEEIFKKHGSWVEWQHQETPGAMYIFKWAYKNKEKVSSGEVPPMIFASSTLTAGHTIEGRKPFDKLPLPSYLGIFSSPGYISCLTTFNPEIKTLRDLEGKKVGIAARSRPFNSTLALKPYFDKELGIWDKVKWQYIGMNNAKDAMLNNKIDAKWTTFWAKIEKKPDGTYVCKEMAPYPADLELINSGRKLHIISYDPELMKKAFDPKVDVNVSPVLVKKGAYQGIDQDFWGQGRFGVYYGQTSIPDDVIQEIIRVRYEYRDEFGKYHATMKFFPENPYPIGLPKEWVHPGVEKAMKNLGIPIP